MKLLSTFLVALGLATGSAAPALAQSYPSKPIRLVVPFEAGGTSDTTARMVAQQLEKQMGQTIVVDNKAGANGAIGAQLVAKAPADGYTLLHTTPAFVINPFVNKATPYDVQKDFVPITNVGVGTGYVMVVNPKLPVKNLQEFIAYEKARKQPVPFSSPGTGNALHLAAEMFGDKAGLELLHIPFKGTSPALTSVAQGDTDFMILPPTIAHPFIQSGRVRAVGFTGPARSADFPTVPTMQEAGTDLVITGTWLGWFAPAGTPQPVIDRLASEIRKALQDPQLQQSFTVAGFKVDGRPPAEFAQFVRSETERFGKVLKNIKMDNN
jgi:tripartite-type tricarboxylate transporter receptor subunit TctC